MNNTNLVPIVDADYLLFRIGFAVGDEEPLEYALATLRSSIHNIWDRFPDSPRKGQLYVSGKGNFRDNIATIQIYKGNRDPSHRPKYYSEMKEYMIKHHGAITADGMEAEDMCGIVQYAHRDKSTVIVGMDKDLMVLPGFHYHPIKDILMYHPIEDANTCFWKQVLTGDRTDNILGIKGLGPKTADKIIDPCEKDWVRMAEATLAEYRKHYGNDAESVMDENAKLIWILRKEGETYNGSKI